ncbi:MAG TPA: hypothetical protein VIW29_13875, partial [Polyangiaceae bacterium]
RGDRVLLVLDSITRFAHALREVATGTGEPPVARGYPASVFTELPKLLERAGPGVEGSGSITAIISVLIDGDDHNDPVADSVRGILDGHVVLDRRLAARGHYPAIDVLTSLSRVMPSVTDEPHRLAARRARALLAVYEEKRELIALGAYGKGSDARVDQAILAAPELERFLRQEPSQIEAFTGSLAGLRAIADRHPEQR